MMKRKINISRFFLVVLTIWLLLFVSGCSQGISVEDYDILSNQLSEAQSRVIELQNELIELQNNNSVQEQQIKQSLDNLMILQNEIFTLQQQIADLNEDNEWLRDKITNLYSEIADLYNILIPTTSPTPTPTIPPTPTPTEAQLFVLMFTTALTPQLPEYLMVYKPMLDEIEQKSSGKIKFEVFPGAILAPATKQYDAIVGGIADMGVSYFSDIAGRFPLSDAFTFPVAYSIDSASQDLIEALGNRIFALAPSETEILCYFYQQPLFLYTAHKQVTNLDDLIGLKLRATSSLQAEILISLGAVPVYLESSDMYIALQRGVIDGILATPSTVDIYNLIDVTKYVLRLPFGYKIGMININTNTWSSIPDDLKPIFQDATEQAVDDYVQKFNTDDAKVNSMLMGQGGAVYTPSTTSQVQWVNAIKPVITQWIVDMESAGLPAQDMLTSIRIEAQQRGVPFPY
jgi:TRAP-type C4-dicarboxylate transport system substrate-binding protein/cell division protein FtsB